MPHIPFACREDICKQTVGSWLLGLGSTEAGSLWDHASSIAYVTYCAMREMSCTTMGAGGHGGRPVKWAHTALAGGAVLFAVLEFYRLVVAPYEDEKISEHGAA